MEMRIAMCVHRVMSSHVCTQGDVSTAAEGAAHVYLQQPCPAAQSLLRSKLPRTNSRVCVRVRAHARTCVDMCIGVCIDICIDICTNLCLDMPCPAAQSLLDFQAPAHQQPSVCVDMRDDVYIGKWDVSP